MSRTLVGLILLLGVSIASHAASVSNIFVPNSPARAADVNQNFTDLVNAINTLEARVQALENPVVTAASIAGTYAYTSLEVGAGGGVTGGGGTQAHASGGNFTGTFTLQLGGTASFTISGIETISTIDSNDALPHSHQQSPSGQTGSATSGTTTVASAARATESGTTSGTWALTNGRVVISAPGEDDKIFYPASAKLLIGVNRESSTAGNINDFYLMQILVKQ